MSCIISQHMPSALLADGVKLCSAISVRGINDASYDTFTPDCLHRSDESDICCTLNLHIRVHW